MEHPRCTFRFADIEVDEQNFSVTKAGEPLPLDSPLLARDISTQEIYALEMEWP